MLESSHLLSKLKVGRTIYISSFHVYNYSHSFLVRLAEIKANIYDYSSKLYRACANASPHNMNDAMIGISKEVKVVCLCRITLYM